MKNKNVAFLVALVIGGLSSSAFADPSDSLDVSELDPGSTLTLLQSINTPNSVSDVVTGGRVYQTYPALAYQPQNQPICYLYPRNSGNQNIGADVDVAANSILTLVSSTRIWNLGDSQSQLEFKTATGDLLYFECYAIEVTVVFDYHTITIGEFKQALSGIANLTLPAPQKL